MAGIQHESHQGHLQQYLDILMDVHSYSFHIDLYDLFKSFEMLISEAYEKVQEYGKYCYILFLPTYPSFNIFS